MLGMFRQNVVEFGAELLARHTNTVGVSYVFALDQN